MEPNPHTLKHRPVLLLRYDQNDGPYAGDTDCLYLSLGWSQWDAHTLSVKTLRHTGEKWSRQSEELPLHRAADAVLLIAHAFRASQTGDFTLPPNTFENQREAIDLDPTFGSVGERRAFESLINDEGLRRRLGALRELLNQIDSLAS
jgi:hypothetical protein